MEGRDDATHEEQTPRSLGAARRDDTKSKLQKQTGIRGMDILHWNTLQHGDNMMESTARDAHQLDLCTGRKLMQMECFSMWLDIVRCHSCFEQCTSLFMTNL
ncbi:hypothetical protein AOLI_G00182100 [Acnodon oligacanthus]